MQTSSGVISNGGAVYNYTVKYPEIWCMAFNPIKLVVEIVGLTYVDVTVNDITISAALYNGKANIEINRLLQTAFTEPERTRYMQIPVSLSYDGTQFFATTLKVLWGTILARDTFLGYGSITNKKEDDYKTVLTRRVAWFKNFPFTVNVFIPESGDTVTGISEDGTAKSCNALRYIFDNIATVTLTSGSAGSQAISEIVYDPSAKLFAAKAADGNYYSTWTAKTSTRGDVNDYNTAMYESGIEADDTKQWCYNGNVYRFDSNRGELIEIETETVATKGLVSIDPETAFPDAKIKAKYQVDLSTESQAVIQTMFCHTPRKAVFIESFDESFDYTFNGAVIPNYDGRLGLLQYLVLDVCNETKGYYLRWIDRFGFVQYYLFDEGDSTQKLQNSKYEIGQDTMYGDLHFGNHSRPLLSQAENTIKVCAPNLNKDYAEYVSSIITSPIIDLYVGQLITGKDSWMSVKIEDASYTRAHKPNMQDIELTLKLPNTYSQSL